MITTIPDRDIHSCSYYCDRPECVKAQRDEMRDELARMRAQEPCAWMDRDGDIYPLPETKNWAPPHKMLYAATPAQPAEHGECDECGTAYSFDPTDGGTICVKCMKDKLERLEEAQPAEPVQRLSDVWLPDLVADASIAVDLAADPIKLMAFTRRIVAAIESAIQPQWRDIESAPKDGTEVALHEAGRVFRGCWIEIPFVEKRNTDGEYIDQQDAEAYWMDIETGDSTEPTEWQARPLPLPPKTTK